MITLTKYNLSPNQSLNSLDGSKFGELFYDIWENICVYKGIIIKPDEIMQSVGLLYKLTKGKLLNLTVNDAVSAIEISMFSDDVKKLSVEFFHKLLQKKNQEVYQNREKNEEESLIKDTNLTCSDIAKAVVLRVKHDKGGKILSDNNHTIIDVYNSVLKGINYYTGDKLKNINS